MEVLETIELLVKLIERVAGRYGLNLLRAGLGVMVNVEQAFRLFLDAVEKT